MGDKRLVNNSQAHRYEIFVDEALAGFAEHREEDGAVAFTHTVVEPAFEGQGVGSALASGALDAVRADGKPVLPYCPFIRSYIQRHPAYLDLVAADRRAELALSPGDPKPDRP